MFKRRMLVLTFTACLSLAMASCASKSDQTAGKAPAASDASQQNAAKPGLKSLQIWMKDDYNTYPVAKLVEEKTGYKVQYDMLPQDKPLDKLNLLIASGEPYDVVTIGGGSNEKATYSDYSKRGALVDLTPLIDKFGPNIKTAISQQSLDAMKVDGKVYALPMKAVNFASVGLMIRQDWLDQLNLKAPTTTDELTAVLKAFKEKDPGGNGDKNIPMTINGSGPFIADIVGAFGMPNDWNGAGGKLVPRPLDPVYKDYVGYVADLFKQGLLDKEFAVNKDATAKEKFTSGKAGILPVGWSDVPTLSDALTKNEPKAKMVYIPALKGPNGKMGFSMSSGFDRITFIPKASKHPEDAVKWINAKLEPATFKLIAIGEEGKHYTVKDGAYTPILPIFADERNQANNFVTGSDEKNYPIYWQARVRKDPRLFVAWEFLNMKQPPESLVPDPLGNAPYLPEYAKNNSQLNTMVNDETVKLIVGADSLSNLDAFMQKYKASGGEASSKEVNDWYAAANKK